MMATMYVPLAQIQPLGETVILTINADRSQRATVEREVAAALARTEPAIAFVFRTFDQFIDARITQERLIAMLSSFFGGLALLLAGIGLYGIVAQAVRARQAEIGLRLALGAQPSGIVRLVIHRVSVLVVAGLTIGLAASRWAAQFLAPLLFQVEARDPATFAAAAGVLVAAGLLAAWLPARRAARLDPATVLREG
jgi:ABC-type antimicrobial peptide transport system permease subunit